LHPSLENFTTGIAINTGENGEITIAWDPSFMKTVPGRLKLGAIVSLTYTLSYQTDSLFFWNSIS
jgi:hypothetical protein